MNTAVSLAKMLSGANAFEISDIQEDETEGALTRRSDVTMLPWVENGWMEFSGSTVSGLTMASAERQSHQRRDDRSTTGGPLRSISGVFLADL
jgi:hypothetical protein